MGIGRGMFFHVGCLLLVLGGMEQVTARRYCGNELAKVLGHLCIEYYSMDDVKKSNVAFREPTFTASNAFTDGWPDLNEHVRRFFVEPNPRSRTTVEDWFSRWFNLKSSPPRTKRSEQAVMARFRRKVAEECCYQDCSMDQLLDYCKVVAPGVVST